MAGSLAASLLAHRSRASKSAGAPSGSSHAVAPPTRPAGKVMSSLSKQAKQARSPKGYRAAPDLFARLPKRSRSNESRNKGRSAKALLPSNLKSITLGGPKPKSYMHRINEDGESDEYGGTHSFLAPNQNRNSTKNKFANYLLGQGGSKKRAHVSDASDDDDDSFLLGDSFNGRGVGSGSAQPISDTPPKRFQPAVTDESSTPSRTQEPAVHDKQQPAGIPLATNKLMSAEEEKSRLAVVKALKSGLIESYEEANNTAGESQRAAADDLNYLLTHALLDMTKTLASALERGRATNKELADQGTANISLLVQKLGVIQEKSAKQADLWSKASDVKARRCGIVMEELRVAHDRDMEQIQTLQEQWLAARREVEKRVALAVSDKEAKKEKNKTVAMILKASTG